MFDVPCTKYFLTAGKGLAKTDLTAFDRALLDAGVADVNHVKLSSSLPPACERIPRQEIPPGGFSATAFARMGISKSTFTNGARYLCSAVGVGIPKDKSLAGLIMETSGLFTDPNDCIRKVKEMVREGMGYRMRELADIEYASEALDLTELGEMYSYGATFAAVVLLP